MKKTTSLKMVFRRKFEKQETEKITRIRLVLLDVCKYGVSCMMAKYLLQSSTTYSSECGFKCGLN